MLVCYPTVGTTTHRLCQYEVEHNWSRGEKPTKCYKRWPAMQACDAATFKTMEFTKPGLILSRGRYASRMEY